MVLLEHGPAFLSTEQSDQTKTVLSLEGLRNTQRSTLISVEVPEIWLMSVEETL